MIKILKRTWKRFGNERLPNNTAHPWMPKYKIYSIHELYSASSSIFGRDDYFTHDVAAVARFMPRTALVRPLVTPLEIHGTISHRGLLGTRKEADHQVRASARSGFNNLTWMR
ncbi:MAG TPA: hypothetical protein VK775_22075 [Chthoniobacterales bacterium]|jgi:hypothetical protein|nr:hypothetical protein [Chthoniobacterales bacterium]